MGDTTTPKARSSVSVLAEGYSFLESPRWHAGALWASDFFTKRVLRFSPGGPAETICVVPGQPSGLGWAPDGSLLIVSMTDRRLLRWADDALTEVADLSAHAPWHCNDMVVDGDGRAYVGHFGWDDTSDPRIVPASILCVEPDGAVTVAATDLTFPNGMALTPDGTMLLVAETFASRISAFERAPDGTLGERRTWAAFLPDQAETIADAPSVGAPLLDGIALDAEGALWAGDAAGDAALRIAEGGAILARVLTEPQAAYAVALGGDDGRTLFVCAGTPYGAGDPREHHVARMLSTAVDVPGVGWT